MNNFKFAHNNINVLDLSKSISFYNEALGLVESSRIEDVEGNFIIVYLGDGSSSHLLELTWLRDWEKPYDLGDNEFHIAFTAVDYEAAKSQHREMGCICYENNEMGIYFIEDPDGYWVEILPANR
ncbi:MAG: VOC family protein [Bacteroidales bacterium]